MYRNICGKSIGLLKCGLSCMAAGRIDGTLSNIDVPNFLAEQFIDRHENHFINVTMVWWENKMSYAVDAYWLGSVHDARVLSNTELFVISGEGWRPFSGAVMLADSAYPLKEWLIPSRRRNPKDDTEQRFY